MAPLPPISIGAPQPWPPPTTTSSSSSSSSSSSPSSSSSSTGDNKSYRDCIPAICTITCPQWCGNLIGLPPPPPLMDDDDSSSNRISPLMAALIAVLAAAFLLLFYYTVVSRLCRRRRTSRRISNNRLLSLSLHRNLRSEILDLDPDPSIPPHDPARPAASGLDESFIRQITVFKYRRSDGLIDGTDCAVCLNEFNEEENLRLMPNCEHAFHIPCIDTWLKTHSNCPLCRATMNPTPPARPVADPGPSPNTVSVAAMQVQRSDDAHVLVIRELENEVIVCHESEEEEEGGGEERENGEQVRKGDSH